MAMRKGIIIDTSKFLIEGEYEYDDTRVDGMFFRVNYKGKQELMPAAYVFPIENEVEVQLQLNKLKQAKKEYDDIVANIYYKVFPTLR